MAANSLSCSARVFVPVRDDRLREEEAAGCLPQAKAPADTIATLAALDEISETGFHRLRLRNRKSTTCRPLNNGSEAAKASQREKRKFLRLPLRRRVLQAATPPAHGYLEQQQTTPWQWLILPANPALTPAPDPAIAADVSNAQLAAPEAVDCAATRRDREEHQRIERPFARRGRDGHANPFDRHSIAQGDYRRRLRTRLQPRHQSPPAVRRPGQEVIGTLLF